jgi:hypothetical protein
MKSRSGTLLLFVGSVVLIIVAIVFTAVIDRSKKNDSRSRAATASTIILTGLVENYDPQANILIVGNVKFADTNGKTLGTWQVTPPSQFNEVKFPSGSKVKITTSPATFQIESKTVVATEITR